ncbi:glycosyltransferase family 39 protein [Cyanobacterium stanieri LEGE 03274]|uniref:Glycosyltransferase family 39 protein n=1 Tax=Cyanobacterium stanieri LEGE 03274 TaxID=1828756 RepID=A0ABR9V190_9CHRO|nr:glycosyltransferase family 39 protein [Cyanobacterium stanieri]MBE9221652.1 glycosyltransferase family 39 protein [Cyanobacterium stanieri LEGE 03274]
MFLGGIFRYKFGSIYYKQELLIISFLFLGAFFLCTVNLGNLPFYDGREYFFAEISSKINHSFSDDFNWLFPHYSESLYEVKPPLMHILTALAYDMWGFNEFATRIFGATLTALSVPLIYCLARELFPIRFYALFGALVYLTSTPIMFYGRLAMFDGARLCFEIFFFLSILISRRDLRWALPVGISLTLICLGLGWDIAMMLGAIALIFLWYDTPRLLTSTYFWLGIILGIIPAVLWYGGEYLHTKVDNYPLINIELPTVDILYYSQYSIVNVLSNFSSWVLIGCFGFISALKNKNYSWGKLCLIWFFISLIITLLLNPTHHYISLLSLYIPMAIACGYTLGEMMIKPPWITYPKSWGYFFCILSFITLGIALFYLIQFNHWHGSLFSVLTSYFVCFFSTFILIHQQNEYFIFILFWGKYISLILLFNLH